MFLNCIRSPRLLKLNWHVSFEVLLNLNLLVYNLLKRITIFLK